MSLITINRIDKNPMLEDEIKQLKLEIKSLKKEHRIELKNAKGTYEAYREFFHRLFDETGLYSLFRLIKDNDSFWLELDEKKLLKKTEQ
jgi:hypothetical protein